VFALLYLVRQTWRQPSSGLILAYCFQMWMLHWIGGLIHALPWADLPESDFVALGFRQSTYGIAAFAVGAAFLGTRLGTAMIGKTDEKSSIASSDLPRIYVIVGVVFYFALAPILGKIRGLNFLPAIGSQFVIVGCCLSCWRAWHKSGRAALIKTVGPVMIIPFVTVVVQGFLGYGIIAISIVMFFCAQFFRPRWVLVAGFALAGYFGLSFYISYMRDRGAIRAAVWGGETLSQRVSVVTDMVTNIDAFTPTNPDHLGFIDGRLNQNTLVGEAVSHLSRPEDFARGDTLWDAALGLIPRIVWPSKPVSAGSGDLVARFTGHVFVQGTSIGIGQVLEFYANFGTAGVLIGFFLMGAVVKALDLAAGDFLIAGNWQAFTTAFLVGISFLNVIGSMVDISMSAAGSLAVASAANHLLKNWICSTPQPLARAEGIAP
jgi:hypothetical protein